MDPFFIQELEYCVSLHQWIEYAVNSKHVKPLAQLIVFVENVFHNLNTAIASDTINVECLTLLRTAQNKVQNIIKFICGGHTDPLSDAPDVLSTENEELSIEEKLRRHEREQKEKLARFEKDLNTFKSSIRDLSMDLEHTVDECMAEQEEKFVFNYKGMVKKMAQLVNWKALKSLFISFLTKFTRANEDEIDEETHEFVHFIKNWDVTSYKAVEGRKEWEEWLTPNRDMLQFMQNISESKVFMNIWIAERQSVANTKWNFNDYQFTLYLKAKGTWDALVDRAHTSKLTLDDKKWFKGSNLIEELKRMKVSRKQLTKIKQDIECALKLDRYVEFAQSLIHIVNIFITKGNTKITNQKDLQTSNSKKDDIHQSIAEAASLFWAMQSAVNTKYDNLHQQWIQTVVKCHHSVKKMAQDPEFYDENISDTIGILDDAVIGSIIRITAQCTHSI